MYEQTDLADRNTVFSLYKTKSYEYVDQSARQFLFLNNHYTVLSLFEVKKL